MHLNFDLSLKTKALIAQIGARVVVYGPLIALSVLFMPMAIPVVVLGALEPYPSRYIMKGAAWAAGKIPVVGPAAQSALNSWLGSKWWCRAGVLEGALSVAFLHLPSVIPYIIASAIMPAIFVTALPLATKLAVSGFSKIPWIRDNARQQEGLAMGDPLPVHSPAVPAPTVEATTAPAPTVPTPAAPSASGMATPAVVGAARRLRSRQPFVVPTAAAVPRVACAVPVTAAGVILGARAGVVAYGAPVPARVAASPTGGRSGLS